MDIATMPHEDIMRRTLVINRWATYCGNCGIGDEQNDPATSSNGTICRFCDNRWQWTVRVHDSGERYDAASKADAEVRYPGMCFIGFGSGSVQHDSVWITRLLNDELTAA